MRVALLVLTLLAVTSVVSSAQQQESGTVEVRLVRSDFMQPLPNANVTLIQLPSTVGLPTSQPARPASSVATTDPSGRAVFSNLAGGRYNLRAQLDGYFGVVSDGRDLSGDVSAVVSLGPGRWTAGITLSLIPGASISGRILGPDDQPVAGADVALFRTIYRDGLPILEPVRLPTGDSRQIGLPASTGAQTNERGEYRLSGLPLGEYYIRSNASGATSRAGQIEGMGGFSYYPGVTDAGRALPVVARAGDVLTGVDFGVGASAGVRVSGTVFSARPGAFQSDGCAAMSVAGFYLVPRNVYAAIEEPSRVPDAAPFSCNLDEGIPFELRDVPAGSYDLYAVVGDSSDPERVTVRTWPSGHTYYSGKTTVEVRAEDIAGVVVQIRPGAAVRGRVLVGDAENGESDSIGAALGRLGVRLIPQETVPAFVRPVRLSMALQRVTADGSFELANVPEGRYRLALERALPPGTYLADVRQGAASIYADSTIWVGTADPTPLEFILRRDGGIIQGTVEVQGREVESAVVALVPEASHRQNLMLYRSVGAPAGQFRIDGVAPGRYKVFAWEYLPEGAELNARFMAPFENDGYAVIVDPRQVANIVVQRIPSR